MPTEVDETIRAITAQSEHYQKIFKDFEKVYAEFSIRCEEDLEKETFDFISDVLCKSMKFYELKIAECNAAKKEIMDKYNIVYTEE